MSLNSFVRIKNIINKLSYLILSLVLLSASLISYGNSVQTSSSLYNRFSSQHFLSTHHINASDFLSVIAIQESTSQDNNLESDTFDLFSCNCTESSSHKVEVFSQQQKVSYLNYLLTLNTKKDTPLFILHCNWKSTLSV